MVGEGGWELSVDRGQKGTCWAEGRQMLDTRWSICVSSTALHAVPRGMGAVPYFIARFGAIESAQAASHHAAHRSTWIKRSRKTCRQAASRVKRRHASCPHAHKW